MNDKMSCLLGVDTGTSKTHALITDLAGNAIGFGESGCGNYELVGEDGLKSALKQSVDAALEMGNINKSRIGSMGFGFSGYDWPSEKPVMERAIASLGISCPFSYENDAVIGLIAGSSNGWGIAVDAGTGNNVRGRDRYGREGRITGNSVWMGEIGGGGEMVWLATMGVTYAWTKRGPKTRLTQLFLDFCDLADEDSLIEGLATDKIHLSPILAMDIIKLADKGDAVAKDIVERSARELGLNINAVIRQLDLQACDFEIVMIGSVFKAGEIYLKPFKEAIVAFAPGASFIPLSSPPVVGAVLLAAEKAELNPPNIRPNLINSTNKLIAKLDQD